MEVIKKSKKLSIFFIEIKSLQLTYSLNMTFLHNKFKNKRIEFFHKLKLSNPLYL